MRDLLLISLAVVAVFWLGSTWNVSDHLYSWLRRRWPGQADEISLGFVVACVGLTLVAILLWRAGRREARARTDAEGRFRALVEKMPAMIYTWDPRQPVGPRTIPYVSPQVSAILGFAAEDWQRDPHLWIERIHPDDRERVVAASDRVDRTGDPLAIEYRHVKPDGDVIWVREESITVERDADGRPALIQGLIYDVTERKRAEHDLAEAEARYRTLVERVPAVTYLWDATHRTGEAPASYISPQIRYLLGYLPEDFDDATLWSRLVHPDDIDRVMAEWAACEGGDVAFRSEYRMRAVDGRIVWVRDEAVPVARDDRGHPLFQGVMFDITDRKVAEERLGAAEERYRTLVEQLPIVVYQDAVDDQSTALYISPQYEAMFGYTPEQRLRDPGFWIDHLHPEDRDRVLEESRRVNVTGEPFASEYRFLASDGRVVWVRDEAVLLHDPDGSPEMWQGILMDVTERRQAEETLSRRDAILESVGFAAERFLKADDWEQTLPSALERLGTAASASRVYVFRNDVLDDGHRAMTAIADWTAPGVASIVDHQDRLPYADVYPRWETTLGSGREICGPVRGFPDAERADLESEGVRSLVVVPVFVGDEWWGFLGFDDCESEREWPTAEIEALKTAADTLGAAIGRARAESQRREAERRYRIFVETIPAVTYVQGAGPGAPVVYVSPQVEQMLGYTPEEWGPSFSMWLDSIHPDDRERVLAADAESDRTGGRFSVEYRQRHKDGHDVWVHDEAMLVRDDDGAPMFWQGIRFDITAQREAEQQVREAEQRYRALVEHIPSVLYVDPVDEHEPTIYVSPRVEQVIGITQQQYLEETDLWRELIHPDDRAWVFDAYRRSLETRTGWNVEYRVVKPDGTLVWIRDESAFLFDDDGEPILVQGVMSDITEQKQAEQALRSSERREREAAERLRALDEMKNTFLAAVSHELRSPLTSILGLALTLEQQDLPREDAVDLTTRLGQNARKLDRLLRDLLDIDRLSRGIVTPSVRSTDVAELARRTVASLELPPDRTILVSEGSHVAHVDAPKVERIVENLVMNAIRHTDGGASVWVRVFEDGDSVVLAVEDDGPGVPPHLREDIFEPFRQGPSRSAHSPGTGIGLSLVAMFADLHGGRAWVQEREGGGASFRVSFPIGHTGNGVGGSRRADGDAVDRAAAH